jgi:hypothetical protein
MLRPFAKALWRVWCLRESPDVLPAANSFLLFTATAFALAGATGRLVMLASGAEEQHGSIGGIVMGTLTWIPTAYFLLPHAMRPQLGWTRAKKVAAAILWLFAFLDTAVVTVSLGLLVMTNAGAEVHWWIGFMQGASLVLAGLFGWRVYRYAAIKLPKSWT